MRGRFPSGKAKTKVTFAISDDINAKISMLIFDPTAGRARYGLKSKLVEELFKRFFQACVSGEDYIKIRDLRIELKTEEN